MKKDIIIKRIDRYKNKLNKLLKSNNKHYLIEYKIGTIERKIKYYEELVQLIDTYDKEEFKKKKALLKEKLKREEILYGNLTRTIFMVCLPIAIYVFFNSFYGLLDSVMCSSISAQSVSDVALLAQIKNAINAFGAGLAGGGCVLVSRYYGAGKFKEAKSSAGNMLSIAIIMSIIICTIMIPFADIICNFVGCEGKQTGLYFSLQMFELAIMSINSIFVGLEKVKGNSKRIFLLNIMMLIIKLTLNILFVYGIRVDSIVWIELSSIVAQMSLFIYGVKKLFSKKNALKVSRKYMKIEKIYIIPILKLSIPIFLGKFVMNMGKFVVNLMAKFMYAATTDGLIVGALAVSNNLNGLITSPANSFEEGESTIVSQNLGNKNPNRTIQTFIRTTIIIMSFSIVGYILVRFIFIDELVNLFAGSKLKDITEIEKSQRLVKYIKEVFIYDSLSIPSLGVVSCVLGLLYGYGKTFLASILNFSRIATRILSLYILYLCGVGYEAVGIAMGFSNIVIMILSIVCFIIFITHYKTEKLKYE